MADDEVMRQRVERSMQEDFIPPYSRMHMPEPDARAAAAAEYTAYQLGQINRKLDRLIVAIEMIAQCP